MYSTLWNYTSVLHLHKQWHWREFLSVPFHTASYHKYTCTLRSHAMHLKYVSGCGSSTAAHYISHFWNQTFLYHYRPQRSWGKVIFSEACVNNSVHGGGACVVARGGAWLHWGGMHGFIWGACMVLFGGACMVLFGGVHGFMRGACVVLFGGCAWFYSGGHAWFYLGGRAWFFQFFRIQWDTVNERAVRILLECILVGYCC